MRLYNSLCRSKLDYGSQIYSSACTNKLKELDVVHNTGLRICSGAFKTSLVESLYIDNEELPLDLRREELGLRYYTKLKGSPDNPAANVIRQCNPRKFENARASRPFAVRISTADVDADIKNQKIKTNHCHKYPPWLIPQASVCQKCVVKKRSSDDEIKVQFLEHDRMHLDWLKYILMDLRP